MNAKHILVVNVYFAPNTYGGATVVAEEVAQALMRRGTARITAISTCERSDLAHYAVLKTEKNGIVNYLINMPSRRSYAQGYDNAEVTARVVELMEVLCPDLVHVHCIQELGTGVFRAAVAAKVPVILSVHDFWWICERQFMQRIDQTYCGQTPIRIEACKGCAEDYWAAKVRHAHLAEIGSCAAIVTYPSAFAKQLSETSGFAQGRGVVWGNGVHLPGSRFVDAQAARRTADPRLTFGYLGGPSHLKGWPQIKQAFGDIGRNDFKVHVVEGSREEVWWDGVNLGGMSGDWEVVPRFEQDRLDDFYTQIDVLLFMSQWKETYGLAIREALARGIRVIQTDSGGTVEHKGPKDRPFIAIGASAQELRIELEHALAVHPDVQNPVQVQSFDAQAQAFEKLMARVI
jgi:glycosyltransferase involved in cell wall biosynthesis